MTKVIKLDTPALVLRTSGPDLRSYYNGSFQWPEGGHVSAPDWDASPHCGNGLHGLLWGQGDAGYLTFAADAKWQVVEIGEYVNVHGGDGHPPKVKYPEGNVVFTGSREEATAFIYSQAPNGTAVAAITLTGGNGSTLTGGDDSTLTGGYGSTLTGGNRSTLTGGNGSTLTGGNRSTLTGGNGSTLTGGNGSTLTGGDDSTLTGGYGSTLTGGNRSTLTGGNRSTLTGGYGSTLTGGNGSTLTGGNGSTLTGGDDSTLTGGYGSTLTGGNRSTLTGGNRSTLTGGYGSTLTFKFYDYSAGRYRRRMVETGDDIGNGLVIEAGKAYRCNNSGIIVPVA